MNIVEKAIKNNEIKFLLEGTNGYKLENDSWASISAPIDWTRVVPLIYKQYEKSFDANIEKMFVKAIVDMLNGNAEEVYCGVAVLYFQILMEESSRAPFCVDRESLIKIAYGCDLCLCLRRHNPCHFVWNYIYCRDPDYHLDVHAA